MSQLTLGVPIVAVTALEFCSDLLFVGAGPALHVYDTRTARALACHTALHPANIHGIRLEARSAEGEEGSRRVCVFGGRLIRVVTWSGHSQRLACAGAACELSEWLLDARWLSEDVDVIAVATAHNSVVLWRCDTGERARTVRCEECCILYSAHLVGSSSENLVVIAGTVFNQVVVWPVGGAPSGSEAKQHSPVMHRLAGHQGVIFAIAYDLDRHRLCSASDDRSIRLWHVTMSGSDVTHDAWRRATFELSLVLYGHTARVWGVRLLEQHIVSVGEDATCFIWNYEGQVVQKFKGHKGKSIWSVAVHQNESLVATGGADCSVRLWRHLAGSVTVGPLLQRCLPSASKETKTEGEINLVTDDYPRSIAMLGSLDNVVVMSNKGVLRACSVSSWRWALLLRDARYASYSVVAPSSDGRCVHVGSMDGRLRTIWLDGDFDVLQSWEQSLYPGKVLAVCWLEGRQNRRQGQQDWRQFLTSGPDGIMTLWRLQNLDRPLVLRQLVLPPMKQRWVTTAALVDCQRALVCGDRGGSVHVYSLLSDILPDAKPVQSLRKIHGHACVTHVCCHGDHVFTCGRDGHYRKYSVHDGKLHVLFAHKVSKGFDWLTRLIFREDGDMIILGFHMGEFVIESVGGRRRVGAVGCGGGHRGWDARLTAKVARLVYLKDKKVATLTLDLDAAKQTVLKPALHGREVTCVKHLLNLKTHQGSGSILITGSEDTLINVVAVETSSHRHRGRHRILASFGGHISSVRALCLLPLGGASSVVFSAGGRAQLNVCKIKLEDVSQPAVGEPVGVGDHVAPPGGCDDHVTPSGGAERNREKFADEWRCVHEQITTHMLRGSSRHDHRVPTPDAETRYMSVTALRLSDWPPGGADLSVVAVACSDGCVRLFGFNERQCTLELIAQSASYDHCFLHVQHVVCQTTNQKRAYVVSAATDGNVAFWDITDVIVDYVRGRRKFAESSSSTAEGSGDESEILRSELESCEVTTKRCTNRTNNCSSDLSDGSSGALNRTGSDRRSGESRCPPLQMAAPVCTVKAHQSGVSTIDLCHLDEYRMRSLVSPIMTSCYAPLWGQVSSDNRLLLVTGGDDNALSVFIVDMCHRDGASTCPRVSASVTCATAHSAQITAVKLLAYGGGLVSTSIDQRLTVWTVNLQPTLTIEKAATRFHSVADPADMDVWENTTVEAVVCGVGLQTATISRR